MENSHKVLLAGYKVDWDRVRNTEATKCHEELWNLFYPGKFSHSSGICESDYNAILFSRSIETGREMVANTSHRRAAWGRRKHRA